MKDTNQPWEARLTFMRPIGIVETELFDTAADAEAWIRRRLRQLDAEGFATTDGYIRREVFARSDISEMEGGAR